MLAGSYAKDAHCLCLSVSNSHWLMSISNFRDAEEERIDGKKIKEGLHLFM